MEFKSQSHISVNMDKISIIHLSDFHFNKENESEIETVLKSLIDDINNLKAKYNISPYFIVISGDIADKGAKSDYDFAVKWLYNMMDNFDISRDRVFIVPGNHDIDRTQLLKFSEIKFTDQRSVNKFLESDAEEKKALSKKLNNFFDFINEFYDNKNPYSNNFYFSTSLKIGNHSMGIVGLNSVWFSSERRFDGKVFDEKTLVIGDILAREAYDSVKDTDFCVTIMHHPFSWLADFNEGLIKMIVMKNSDVIFHGHIHSNSASETITPDSTCITLSAGASFIENRDKRYSILAIDPNDLSYTIYLRRFSEDGKFWASDTMTYQTGEGIINGVIKCESDKKEEYPFSDPDLLITDFVKHNWKTLAYSEYDKDKILGRGCEPLKVPDKKPMHQLQFRKNQSMPSACDFQWSDTTTKF
jgi:3',5'-cyclic AMP phosphodiesterase CpdA